MFGNHSTYVVESYPPKPKKQNIVTVIFYKIAQFESFESLDKC